MTTKLNDVVLGIDLGTASVGWALVHTDPLAKRSTLVATGVRIFPEITEAKTGALKNAKRRLARQLRKQLRRRKYRIQQTKELLVNLGLLPVEATQDGAERALGNLGNPYQFRAEGLDRMLRPYELGRALLHLAKRRGFKSGRKDPQDKEANGIKKSMAELQARITESGKRTLGEYLYSIPHDEHGHPIEPLRNRKSFGERYTTREMYEHEFEMLLAQQRQNHATLTPEMITKLYRTIFFQRPLQSQKHLIGKCLFELEKSRCPWWRLEAQQFRILQDVNHLRITDPISHKEYSLSDSQRATLQQALEQQETMAWGKVRKLLGLHSGEIFNLEEGKKDKLTGNVVAAKFFKTLGEKWRAMSNEQRGQLVEECARIEQESSLLRRLRGHWKLNRDEAEGVCKIELPQGYARLSLRAIRKILPHLESGMRYDEAATRVYGDHRRAAEEIARNALGPGPRLRNPVVEHALAQLRKVVNAIIRAYGKPGLIRIEMARDLKLNKREKDELLKEQRKNEKLNQFAAEQCLALLGVEPSRDDLIKYRLWQESDETCPYTLQRITPERLFSGEVDIEHIIPYSRSFDDSFGNKTICVADFNRSQKRERTPYEVFAHDEGRYEQVRAFLRSCVQNHGMSPGKMKRFVQTEVDTDRMLARQLSDTRYICSEAKRYLESLGVPVEVTKGKATAMLRQGWGLNGLLDPEGKNDHKNRGDHRHHAIDACIIAVTDSGVYHRLAGISKRHGWRYKDHVNEVAQERWPNISSELNQALESMVVSHAQDHRITGAFHEETAIGKVNTTQGMMGAQRIGVNEITNAKKLAKVADPTIRSLIQERVSRYAGDFKRALDEATLRTDPLLHRDGKTPIRTVRIHEPLNEKVLYRKGDKRYYAYGNNHHVEILEYVGPDKARHGERRCIFVTAMEAAQRCNRLWREGLVPTPVQRDYGTEWRFVMSLCANDVVRAERDRTERLWRVQKMSEGEQMQITLKVPTSTSTGYDPSDTWVLASPNSTRFIHEKLAVDPLGIPSISHD